jgi:hypothetical protein
MGLWLSAPAGAASWAEAMFAELTKDFGAVPRGPALTHPFRFTNTGQTAVHVSGIRVSCGCVSAYAAQYEVAPGETGIIHARMDTTRFLGHKGVTVYVTFDRPRFAEVRLYVQANGRDDVQVAPSSVELGKIKRGAGATGQTSVTIYGSDQWQITEVERESNYVQPELKEESRQGGQVRYELTVALRADTPVGRWYTDLWLKTNNPAMPRVRVPLNVEVESGLSLLPATASFGQVPAGSPVERRIILKGTEPFRITDIQGDDGRVRVTGNHPDAKALHVLTVQLDPHEPGDVQHTVRVLTDLKEEGQIEIPVTAQVMPPIQGASR